MDTKDTAQTTAPSVAPPKPASKRRHAGEPQPQDPVRAVPLSGLEDYSIGSLGAAFSGLHVQTPEGKAKETERRKGGARDDRASKHEQSEDVSSGEKPSGSAPGAAEHRATSSATATTLPATHPAASSSTTTPPVAEGTGFPGTPEPTHGLEQLATEPPMAPSVREPVASGFSYVGIHEPTSCHNPAAFCEAPIGAPPLTML